MGVIKAEISSGVDVCCPWQPLSLRETHEIRKDTVTHTYTATSLWPRRAQGTSYMLSSLTIEMQKADRASYMAESSRGCVMDCTSVPVQVCLFKVWFDKTCSCELAEVDSSFPVIFTPTLLSWTNKHTHGHTLGCQSKWAYLWLLLPRTSFKTKALSLHF